MSVPPRQKVFLLLLLTVLCVNGSGGTVQPSGQLLAQTSAPPPGTYELIARHSTKCLDVDGASTDDGAPLIQWSCHGGLNQRWRLESTGDGYVRLIAMHSGKALDVDGASTSNGAPLIQWTPHNGINQHWQLQAVGGGYYTIAARHSGKVMDVGHALTTDGAPLLQWPANGNLNQQWLLRPVDGIPPDDAPSTSDAIRFLEQSTWGPTPALIDHVKAVGFDRFLDEQFNAPASSYPTMTLFPTTRDEATCPAASTCPRDNYTMYPLQNRFFVNALYGEDQLRQRVAFALHQIIVVSGVDITQPSWMAPYLQVLDRNAFGNYRQLLLEITLNPAMGNYLDINNNNRTLPNENYAREILQLFSIGTVRLNLDGTQQLDGNGQAIPAYTQDHVNNFARVFTGWRFATAPATGVPNYIDPMVSVAANHDTGAKTLLNGRTLASGRTAAQDLSDALDNIFEDDNIGPFISKQLIQHLVTSNPSPAYVARVASVFNGSLGARGDLKAVVRAILLDPEARGDQKGDASYGRLKHPAQYIANVLRAFDAKSADLATQSDGYLNPQAVNMGMDLFRPPSVFSYFSPSGTVPGSGGVRGPEFGLMTTSTALRRANFINTMAFSRIAVGTNSPAGTSLDLAPLQALAGNPGALVDSLNTLLLHGSMSSEMRSSIVSAVTAVAASNPLKRARTALYLVASSSQYQVER
jgi:uncharacterized protein (DUF1800 family)